MCVVAQRVEFVIPSKAACYALALPEGGRDPAVCRGVAFFFGGCLSKGLWGAEAPSRALHGAPAMQQ